jgi:hypothetical protein
MSFYFNGAQANVTITGNSTMPTFPSGASVIIRDGNDTADLYTVTAGKTLYIISAYATASRNSVAGGQGTAWVEADILGDAAYRVLIASACSSTATSASASAAAVSFPIPISVPATKKVRLAKASTPDVIKCGFIGYEV